MECQTQQAAARNEQEESLQKLHQVQQEEAAYCATAANKENKVREKPSCNLHHPVSSITLFPPYPCFFHVALFLSWLVSSLQRKPEGARVTRRQEYPSA